MNGEDALHAQPALINCFKHIAALRGRGSEGAHGDTHRAVDAYLPSSSPPCADDALGQTMTKNNARVAENALRAVQQDVFNGEHEGVETSFVVSTMLAAGFGHKEVP